MDEPKYLIDIFNLKFAMNFAKMFLFTIVLSIAYLVFAEYTRIQDTCMAMAMFTRIAGNYALTSSQDVDSLTNGSSARDISDMYNSTEYSNYLNALNEAASVAENPVNGSDKSLRYAHNILTQSLSVPGNSEGTPMSFNLPYLSYNMVNECFNEAMQVMTSGYLCKGTPSILMCNGVLESPDGSPTYNAFSFRDNSALISTNDLNNEHADKGVFSYDDGNPDHRMSFRLMKMTPSMQMAIYGSATYLEDNVYKILSELDTHLYEDPRVTAMNAANGGNYVLVYNIRFTCPYYYITQARLLAFGSNNQGNNGTSNSVVDFINSNNGTYCYKRGENGTDKYVFDINNPGYHADRRFYKATQPRDGQLCFWLKNSDDRYGTADFSYTYLS